ncbi:Gfo/Idh/MocA family protein [Hymenobacter cavernae]|uniref:Oxidoreductase n=1 Tax=Hymenobacter cavernae TaxID=2044852 RepID=A0ABQ1TZV3_9BACT|nr:Gfo/Idh/MocA family oxidoreductase [Hymenobacter cavernae]GGF05245.1 oxidoreductase [Hymenobacter cavernae]
MRTFNWGIIGLGRIAHKFAENLALLPNARLYGVASRTQAKADEFATQFGAAHACGSYEELLQLPDLDAVYIATPHSEHHANTLLCLRAGVPVLCEKAFALNARQAAEMIATAREQKVFLMEAFWTRFFPAVKEALKIVQSGELGEIKHIVADFGFKAPYNPEGRLYNPALAGGSLLDIGVYPLFISKLLLGNPTEVKAVATFAPSGVDANCAISFAYTSGATASLFSTIAAQTDTTCHIYGTEASLRLNGRFHAPEGLTVYREGEEPRVINCEKLGYGYAYEAHHVQECLEQDLLESPLLPLGFSLELMQLLDQIRAQIGLRYPGEG